MVDVTLAEAIYRFPWIYSKVNDKEGNFLAFRVRLDFIVVNRSNDPYIFDIYHFTSQSDLMDNAQLAKELGLEVEFGSTYIYASPRCHSTIYNQIIEHEQLCVSLRTT